MSTTLPARYNGQQIDASWFNLVKTALSEVIFTPLTITANKTADATNNLLLIDATSNTVEVALPASTGNSGRVYYVKTLNVTNAVTINPNASETIDGASLYTFSAANESVVCACDGTKWVIVSSNNTPLVSSSVITPNRLDVKQGTYSSLSTYSSTASNGQLCFSTDTKKMYQVVDGALTELGAGSGTNGDAETIHLIRSAGLTNVSEIDLTGNNAAFDGGGTITASSLSLSTTAADLILGTSVIKYAPGANGQNDYFGFTKAIPQGQRGRSIGFSFEYKNDSTVIDNDFTFNVKIKDGAQAGYIYTDNITKHYTTTNESVRFSQGYFIPADCTEVEFGWRNTSATTTLALMIDNILVSANPFVYKNLLSTQYIKYDTYAGYGSTNTKIPYFTTATANTGTQLLAIGNSATNGFSITALRDCIVTATFAMGSSSGSSYYVGITLNSTQLTTNIASVTAANVVGSNGGGAAGDQMSATTAPIAMKAGWVLRPHTEGDSPNSSRMHFTATALAESDNIVTPAKSAIEEIHYDTYSSTSTYVKFANAITNTLSKLASVDNTTYTKFTALKKVIAKLSMNCQLSSGSGNEGISVFNSANVLQINKAQNVTSMGGVAFDYIMEAGDYAVVTTSAGTWNNTTQSQFSAVFVAFDQQILSASPKNHPGLTVGATRIAKITYSGGVPSATYNPGNWITNVSDDATGRFTLTYTGAFTVAPVITATPICVSDSGANAAAAIYTLPTASAVTVQMADLAATSADRDCFIVAIGETA